MDIRALSGSKYRDSSMDYWRWWQKEKDKRIEEISKINSLTKKQNDHIQLPIPSIRTRPYDYDTNNDSPRKTHSKHGAKT